MFQPLPESLVQGPVLSAGCQPRLLNQVFFRAEGNIFHEYSVHYFGVGDNYPSRALSWMASFQSATANACLFANGHRASLSTLCGDLHGRSVERGSTRQPRRLSLHELLSASLLA